MLKRIYAAFVVIIAFAVHSAAQSQTCDLRLTQAPELRGFKLGMSLTEIKAKVVATSQLDSADEIGVREAKLAPIQLRDEQAGRGIRQLTLQLFNDRLAYMEVTYDDSVKWDDVNEFTSTLSRTLNLPNLWGSPVTTTSEVFGVPVTATGRKLSCAGFNVGAITANGRGVLMLGEAGLREAKDRRRESLKKSQQQTFKP